MGSHRLLVDRTAASVRLDYRLTYLRRILIFMLRTKSDFVPHPTGGKFVWPNVESTRWVGYNRGTAASVRLDYRLTYLRRILILMLRTKSDFVPHPTGGKFVWPKCVSEGTLCPWLPSRGEYSFADNTAHIVEPIRWVGYNRGTAVIVRLDYRLTYLRRILILILRNKSDITTKGIDHARQTRNNRHPQQPARG